jgi:hypothetical protein
MIDFDSYDALDQTEFVEMINAVLPEGFRFKTLVRLEAGAKSLIKEVNRAEYRVRLDVPEIEAAVQRLTSEREAFAAAKADDIHRIALEDFMQRESYFIERVRKNKHQRVDVRRFTRNLRFVDDHSLSIVTEVLPNGGVKPTEVLASVYGLTRSEMISLSSRVQRLRLYFEEQTGDPENLRGIAAALMSEQGDDLRVTTVHS